MSGTPSRQSSANSTANSTPTPTPKRRCPLACLNRNQILKIIATILFSLIVVATLIRTAAEEKLETGSLSNDQFKSKANIIAIYIFTVLISGIASFYYFK